MKKVLNVIKDKAFLRRFFAVAFPVMVQNFITFIVGFVDNIMVSSVSNEAVSAIYAANQATFLFFILTYGIISGAAIYIQQYNGANDEMHLRQAFRFKWLAMGALLLVVMPLYYFLGDRLIWFYCKSDINATQIYELGVQYLKIILISYIPYGISCIYANTFREISKTKIPMLTALMAFIINVTFNAIFIYGLKMGVIGAAIATVIARIAEMIVLIAVAHLKREKFCLRLFTHFRIEKVLLKDLIKKSIPLFINEAMWSTGMIMLSLAYAQRDSVLSALSVVSTVSEVFNIIFQGLCVGIGVMVGNTLGANKLDEAKENAFKIYVLGLIISICVGIIVIALSPVIPLMFSKVTPEQKKLATQLIIVFASLLWAFSLCNCGYATIRSGGKALMTLLLEESCMWLLAVPAAWILATFTNVSLVVIYIVVQGVDVIKAFAGIIIVKRGAWVKNLTIKEQ